MDIYVQKDGQQHGPYPESKIRRGIDAGEFDPADLAWTVGKASWQPLSVLINLDTTNPPPFSVRPDVVLPPLQKTISRTHTEEPPPVISISNQVDAPVSSNRSLYPRPISSRTSNTPRRRQEALSSRIYGFIAYTFLAMVVIVVGWKVLQAFLPIFESEEQDDVFHIKGYHPAQPTPSSWQYQDGSKSSVGVDRFQRMPILPDKSRANLWGTEEEFIKVYGEPIKRSHVSIPAGTEDLQFPEDDLIYAVSFWQERAHQVNVYRKDHKALTDEQVQQALKAFSGGDEWSHKVLSGVFGKDRWERTSVIAWMVPAREEYPDKHADIPETMLTISTNEFSAAWDQANKSSK